MSRARAILEKVGAVEKKAVGPLGMGAMAMLGVPGEIAGLVAGVPTGRSLAGETAAEVAPYGRQTRSKELARQIALVGAPAGGIGALLLAKKYGLTPRVLSALSKHFPKGVLGSGPAIQAAERGALRFMLPAGAAMAGSAAGGALTGAGVGGAQRLRGTPKGVRKDKPKEKESASKKEAPYQQTRKGRRPIRVHNLLKKASLPGQDMRNPGATPGKMKPPTKDSTSFASKKLQQSSAEVGPMAKSKSAESLMIENDPLMQHLKQAAAENKTKGLVDSEGKLEANKEDVPRASKDVAQVEISSEDPMPTMEMKVNGELGWRMYLERMFDNKVVKKKCESKDFPATAGQVDKVLKR